MIEIFLSIYILISYVSLRKTRISMSMRDLHVDSVERAHRAYVCTRWCTWRIHRNVDARVEDASGRFSVAIEPAW